MDQGKLETLRDLLDEYNAKSRSRKYRKLSAAGDFVLNCVIDDVEMGRRAAAVVSISERREQFDTGLRLVPEPVRAIR